MNDLKKHLKSLVSAIPAIENLSKIVDHVEKLELALPETEKRYNELKEAVEQKTTELNELDDRIKDAVLRAKQNREATSEEMNQLAEQRKIEKKHYIEEMAELKAQEEASFAEFRSKIEEETKQLIETREKEEQRLTSVTAQIRKLKNELI